MTSTPTKNAPLTPDEENAWSRYITMRVLAGLPVTDEALREELAKPAQERSR